jgi:hypothetical protein
MLKVFQASQCDIDIRITRLTLQVPENEILLLTPDLLNGVFDFSIHWLLDPGG